MLGGNLGLDEVRERTKSGYYKNVAPDLVKAEKERINNLLKLGIENNLKNTSTVGGRLVAKDRPGGFMRGLAGFGDWATFGISDWDKQGNLFGGQHSKTGFGKIAPGYEKEGGQFVAKEGYVAEDPLNPGGGVITEKEADKIEEEEEKEEFDKWQSKLKETEAAGNRLADRNLIRKNIAALPALMAAGNLGVAEAAKGHSEQTVRAMAHIPQLQLAAMSYQPMINYSLGR